MSRTITAMFDSRSEAEAAKSRLTASNIDASRVRIIDQSTGSSGGSALGGSTTGSSTTGSTTGGSQGGGFWSSLRDMFMPDEDRHAYGEGISRGHFLVAADVEENQADEACRILEQSQSLDYDQETSNWRSQGWGGRYEQGYEANDRQAGAFGALGGGTDRSTLGTSGTTGMAGSAGMTSDRDRVVDEERIPVVEEQLRVGKREVNRGGARVRSYVREIPVHEDVSLHSEHVSVERRPVNETLGRDALRAGGELFQDREIEMTEHSEEAVVGKEAIVREEVVVRKTAEDRVESIDDTVRRTEVDVDEGLTRGDNDRSALFGRDRDGDRDNDGIPDAVDRDRSSSLSDRDRY